MFCARICFSVCKTRKIWKERSEYPGIQNPGSYSKHLTDGTVLKNEETVDCVFKFIKDFMNIHPALFYLEHVVV